MTQYEGNCDTVWFWGRGFMRFAEGRYGLCGGAVGRSASPRGHGRYNVDGNLRFAYKRSGDRFPAAGARRPSPNWGLVPIF